MREFFGIAGHKVWYPRRMVGLFLLYSTGLYGIHALAEKERNNSRNRDFVMVTKYFKKQL